jgi:hypothetical protein
LIPHADEWLRDSHEDPEEEEDIESGEMRGPCEVFQGAPDGADGKSPSETPEHGLNDDGTFKLVRLLGDVEANDGKGTDERQCRQDGEHVDDEAGGTKMVE